MVAVFRTCGQCFSLPAFWTTYDPFKSSLKQLSSLEVVILLRMPTNEKEKQVRCRHYVIVPLEKQVSSGHYFMFTLCYGKSSLNYFKATELFILPRMLINEKREKQVRCRHYVIVPLKNK